RRLRRDAAAALRLPRRPRVAAGPAARRLPAHRGPTPADGRAEPLRRLRPRGPGAPPHPAGRGLERQRPGRPAARDPLQPGLRALPEPAGHAGLRAGRREPVVTASAHIPDPGRGRKGLAAVVRNWTDLRHTPYGTRPVAVFALLGLVGGLAGPAFALAAPDIVVDLRIDVRDILNVQATIGFFLIFAAIALGWYADRHPRVPLFGLGTVVSGLFRMVTAGAHNLPMLGTPEVLGGVAGAASDVPSFSLMADYYPPESRGKVFSILGIVGRTASLPLALTAALMIDGLGWRTTFVIGGALVAVSGLVILVALREPVRGYMERRAMGAGEEIARQEGEPQSFGEAWRTVWAVRTLRRQFIAAVVATPGATVYALLLPFLLVDQYGLRSATERFAALAPASFVAGLLGAFVGGALIDRLSAINPSRVLVGALGPLGAATLPPLWLLVGFSALLTFGYALVGPAAQAITTQIIPPVVRTQGVQMLGLAAIPGLIFFVPMAGMLRSQYGYSVAILFCVPFAVVGALVNLSAASFFEF